MDELTHLGQDASLPNALRRRRPLMPTVILTANNMVASRIAPCNAHSCLRRGRSRFEKPHLACAWNVLHAKLCVLDFLGCDEGVAHAPSQLRHDSIIHHRILIAEQDGTKPHVIVGVLVSIGIPNMPSLAVVDIDRRNPLDMRLRPLAVKLASRENGILRRSHSSSDFLRLLS